MNRSKAALVNVLLSKDCHGILFLKQGTEYVDELFPLKMTLKMLLGVYQAIGCLILLLVPIPNSPLYFIISFINCVLQLIAAANHVLLI